MILRCWPHICILEKKSNNKTAGRAPAVLFLVLGYCQATPLVSKGRDVEAAVVTVGVVSPNTTR